MTQLGHNVCGTMEFSAVIQSPLPPLWLTVDAAHNTPPPPPSQLRLSTRHTWEEEP